MGALEREVNPFNMENLRRWLEDTEQRLDDKQLRKNKPGKAALFWDIPDKELKLTKKVASGSGGTVWLAKFEGRNVAAKQLFSLVCVSKHDGC